MTVQNRTFGLVQKLGQDERGVVAVLVAICVIPLVIAAGVAIDLGRAYKVEQRLAQAADAAGLAVGASYGNGQNSNTVLNNFFSANFPAGKLGASAASASLNIDGSQSVITVTATATVDMTFMQIAGIQNITVSASSEITRETTGIEVVMVLDNTGSMGNSNKLQDMQDAAKELVDTLFDGDATSSTVKIGLVPFAGSVNIGNSADIEANFVTTPSAFDWYTDSWAGCVMARTSPYDTTDDSVAVGGRWDPFYWADTPYPYASPYWDANNWRFNDGTLNIDFTQPQDPGPNKWCPREVTPLTNVKADIDNEIDAMWAAGYTHVNFGAVWGWRLISPDAPFTEGVAYNNSDWNKAVVILTDGVNTTHNEVYTAYDYRWANVLGSTSSSGTTTELNSRLSQICTNIKNAGIQVYTITFNVSDATLQTLFENCATAPTDFYNSPDAATLDSAFRAIGASLKKLRVSG